jgi:hypothetical protein
MSKTKNHMCLIIYLFPLELSTFLLMESSGYPKKGDRRLIFTKRLSHLSLFGGDEGDRTPGLGVANAALSQLSYIPIFLRKRRGKRAPLAVSGGAYMIRPKPVKK